MLQISGQHTFCVASLQSGPSTAITTTPTLPKVKLSPEEDAAMKQALKEMTRFQTSRLITNVVNTISTLACFGLPILIAIQQSEWRILILLTVYPLVIGAMSVARYGTKQALPGIMVAGVGAITGVAFLTMTSSPDWYWVIVLGLSFAYYMQFYRIPMYQQRVDRAFSNPLVQAVQTRIGSNRSSS